MFKISEFSKLSQISAKTLRYYDQIGLLKPSQIDSINGYRYYSADQLLRVNQIHTLKDLGFTLEQIIPILDQEITADRIRSMLLHKEAEVKSLLEAEQARLWRIQSRLAHLERDYAEVPVFDVSFKQLEPKWIASIREVTSRARVEKLWKELEQYAAQNGLAAPSTWMVLWHQCAECEESVDLEVAIPVASSAPQTERVHVRLLEETLAACIVHECHPHGLCTINSKLGICLEENGYQIRLDLPSREIYVTSTESGAYLAEIQMPVESNRGERG